MILSEFRSLFVTGGTDSSSKAIEKPSFELFNLRMILSEFRSLSVTGDTDSSSKSIELFNLISQQASSLYSPSLLSNSFGIEL